MISRYPVGAAAHHSGASEKRLTLLEIKTPNGFKTDPEFRFEVVLGEPDPLKDRPVVETLRKMADEIENLLRKLELLA